MTLGLDLAGSEASRSFCATSAKLVRPPNIDMTDAALTEALGLAVGLAALLETLLGDALFAAVTTTLLAPGISKV